jgi:hypothetical protein
MKVKSKRKTTKGERKREMGNKNNEEQTLKDKGKP